VLERAWRLRPDWLEAGMALASVLESRGELVRARQALEDLTARYPGSADAWSNLGQVRAREGEYDLARAAWSKALELEPAHPQARANMLMLKKTIR
jgi:Flp pilus assembly protein TadD